jgi:hypothetical protein
MLRGIRGRKLALRRDTMRAYASLVLILLVASLTLAGKELEAGKLIGLVVEDIGVPLPGVPQGSSVSAPIGKQYRFEIESHEFVYVASCWSKDAKYKVHWVLNDPVQFRVENGQVFLKNSAGRDLRLALIVKADMSKESSDSPAIRPVGPFASHRAVPQCR